MSAYTKHGKPMNTVAFHPCVMDSLRKVTAWERRCKATTTYQFPHSHKPSLGSTVSTETAYIKTAITHSCVPCHTYNHCISLAHPDSMNAPDPDICGRLHMECIADMKAIKLSPRVLHALVWHRTTKDLLPKVHRNKQVAVFLSRGEKRNTTTNTCRLLGNTKLCLGAK